MSIHSQYVTGRKVSILIYPWVFQEANIRSVYNLCSSIPFEELTVSPSSVGTVSLLIAEIVASPGIAAPYFIRVPIPHPVASPTSAYSLSTAVT